MSMLWEEGGSFRINIEHNSVSYGELQKEVTLQMLCTIDPSSSWNVRVSIVL